MVRILIGGDFCPIGRNQTLFEQGNTESLFSDLLPHFEKADLSILNLECPLIEVESPIEKCGPVLGAPTACVKGIKAAGIDVLGLANNHIMDNGWTGLNSTLETLQQEGISCFGAGKNLEDARKIWIKEINGLRIGLIGIAEHEYSIAEDDKPGANPMDIIDFVRNVQEQRSKFDYLVVLLHGGNENYLYPRPKLVDTCRFLVEQGANAVICQHSHCFGCMETYQGAPIVYGQGNFLFDMPVKLSTWNEGALITLDVDADCNTQCELTPYIQSREEAGARKMTPDHEEQFLHAFHERSKAIEDESFLLARWEEFCKVTKRYHLHLFNHPPSLFRRVFGKLDILHLLDSSEKQRMRLNILRCESVREATTSILLEESKK
jgi:hypothetical protein